MKILIPADNHAHTGKGFFTNRLYKAMKEMGVDVTNDKNAKVDICLHIGRVHFKAKAKKNILRCGPACIDKNDNYKKRNKAKWDSVKKVDGIVYQSEYSKKIYHKLVGKRKIPETVIFNGADPKEFDVEQWPSDYKYNFLASTRKWIPQKRLKDTIRMFERAEIEDSCLWICGNTLGWKYKGCPDNVKFLGPTKQKDLARLYKLCDGLLHFVWVDACPNTVVESLVAGCPVLCTNAGGTCELIWANKGTWSECLRWDDMVYSPVDLSHPPKMDLTKSRGIFGFCWTWWRDRLRADASSLHIQNIAQQYLKFFEEVWQK